jgi:hypothetical protein
MNKNTRKEAHKIYRQKKRVLCESKLEQMGKANKNEAKKFLSRSE